MALLEALRSLVCAALAEAAACYSLFAAASAEPRAAVTLSLMDYSALPMFSTASLAVLLMLQIAVSAVSCTVPMILSIRVY